MSRSFFSLFVLLMGLHGAADVCFCQEDEGAQVSIDDLAWLAGSWTGQQGRTETEEHWLKPKGGLMLATNRTVNGDRGFYEFLRIQRNEERIVYYASPAGRPAVAFGLKKLNGQRVVFENLKHDFPQRIIYQRRGNELDVTIEGKDGGQMRRTQWTWRRTGS